MDWDVAPRRALDSSGTPFHHWFPDGRLNVCFNALDLHVEAGRGEQPAPVHDSPVTDTRRTYTDMRFSTSWPALPASAFACPEGFRVSGPEGSRRPHQPRPSRSQPFLPR
ncbi:acetyl-coenzyme A synthetase N-terminal domain-containing protein [Streptomyces sp. QTS52]